MFFISKRGIMRGGACLIWALFIVSTVGAHGFGKQMVAEEQAGPYTVSVWLDPATPTTHEPAHLTVSVSFEAELVHDAEITIHAQHTDSTKNLTSTATHEQAVNKLFYEGELEFKNTGDWLIEISIDGEHGQGQTAFGLTVTDENALPIEWLVGGGIFAMTIIGGAVYELRKTRSEQGIVP